MTKISGFFSAKTYLEKRGTNHGDEPTAVMVCTLLNFKAIHFISVHLLFYKKVFQVKDVIRMKAEIIKQVKSASVTYWE